MAKIYYNDNGTWKVVTVPGGGSGGVDPMKELKVASLRCVPSGLTAPFIYIDPTIGISYKPNASANTLTFALPSSGNSLMSNTSFKTLFGNKSIVGTGNIDLYQHNIKFQSSTNIIVMFTVISSKNVIVDSLTDLKTLLGNTFEYPVSGTAQGTPIMAINQTGYSTVYDYYKGDWITYPTGTWTDTVTTI